MPSKDWGDAFGAIVKDFGGAWPPTQEEVRAKVLQLVGILLVGNGSEIASVMKAALSDGELKREEGIALIAAIFSTWSEKTPFGSAFTKSLADALKDGDLTVNEIAASAAGWLATRSENKNVAFFFREIADGKFSRDDVKSLLLQFIEDKKGKDVSNAIKGLLTGKVLLSEILLLIIVLRFSEDASIDPGSTSEQLLHTLKVYLQGDAPDSVGEVVDRLINGDATGITSIVISSVIHGEQFASLLKATLVEKLRGRLTAAFQTFLAKNIEGLTGDQVKALATAITELLSGKRTLWAEKSDLEEFTSLHYPPEMFSVWTRVRKVIYAARWALTADAAVPLDALARPHVFAAADIKPVTKLKTMATGAKARIFVECIQKFCAVEFYKDSPNGRLQNSDNYPVSTNAIAAGAPASTVLLYVWVALKSGGI